VLNDFKFDAFTWVFPWGVDRKNIPHRSVIVSQKEGIQIRDLEVAYGSLENQ
jgi:hypothetical protein